MKEATKLIVEDLQKEFDTKPLYITRGDGKKELLKKDINIKSVVETILQVENKEK